MTTWAQPYTDTLPQPDTRWWIPASDTRVQGRRSRAQLVADALARAGNPSLTLLANGWLNDWLQKQYAAWPWPFLHVRTAGIELPAGTTSLQVGAGGGVTDSIRRVLDPIDIYTSDRKAAGRVRVMNWLGDYTHKPNPADYAGRPTEVYALPSAQYPGSYEMMFTPFPERDYRLSISFIAQPRPLPADVSGDAFVPVYPEEETMILAVEMRALQHMDERDKAAAVSNELAARATNDRLARGVSYGINDTLPLDRSVFR